MSEYFTDREFGARPPSTETIDERVWLALQALIATRLDDGSLGFRFPKACDDTGRLPYGADDDRFARTLAAEVPGATWPGDWHQTPATPVILDVLEFCAKAVGRPIRGSHHSYHHHTHISGWDRAAGLSEFIGEVNLLLARNGIAFQLDGNGQARRRLPAHIAHALQAANFASGDAETDALLEDARRRFLAPKVQDRRDGVEKLWDAFERLKTLEPGVDKKAAVTALLDRAARPGSRLRQALETEAFALTAIGNTHRIRHSEVGQETLETSAQVDFVFGRLFAFIHLLLASTGRLG